MFSMEFIDFLLVWIGFQFGLCKNIVGQYLIRATVLLPKIFRLRSLAQSKQPRIDLNCCDNHKINQGNGWNRNKTIEFCWFFFGYNIFFLFLSLPISGHSSSYLHFKHVYLNVYL